MPVRLHLFGPPKIDRGGEPFALPLERRSQLLVLLALKRSWVGRVELAAMLWPEQERKLAHANLRKTLFRLQAMPWGNPVESQGNAVRCEAWSDVFDFETAVREGRIADALSVRRGELLAGFDDDSSEAWSSWLTFERERLRVSWRGAALGHLAADIDPSAAIDLSTRLLEADPLDEAALHAQVRWLAQSGQSARARQAYREFSERLADELGLVPGTGLKALHDSLASTALASAPTARLAPAAPDDGFVGRTVELQRIAALLPRDDCRVLCITGPGGVGKTRLAQRAMRELAPGYPDGAAFVPLDDALPGEIGGRLAREIGIGLAGGAEPLDRVIGHLRTRNMLIVLDNFEHLVGDVSTLDKLLRACTRLKVIVTSRVRLATAGEWLLPLEGLPCPEAEDEDRIEAFDAPRLFINAARHVEPTLIPAVEAAAIVDICRQVEGLPLALELAAAWTRLLSCEAIAAELRHGSELLRAVDPARPARHASIEVVFDHSWRLLAEVERDALCRLSVFRGGFTAEAARAVTTASLPVLGALADKSLLRKEGARTFLHPLVHQLAGARLGNGELRETTERAHAYYFHHLLTQLRRGAERGDREALGQLDAEFENCRAAWGWSVAHGDTEALARNAQTLFQFCDHRNRFEEGLALLREAIDSRPQPVDPRFEPLLSSIAAHLLYRLNRYDEAVATATRALAASRDHDTRLQCFKVLAGCSLRQGRYDDARRQYRQALSQSPASIDPHNAAAMLDNLALVEKMVGRYAESMRMSMQSLVQHRQLGDAAGEALCLNNLASLQMDVGENESAAANFKAGLELCERHGLVNTRGFVLANLTELALQTGDAQSARTYGGRALEAAVSTGNRAIEGWVRRMLADIALLRGDLPAARADLQAAMEIFLAVAVPSLQLEGIISFAELLAAQAESECARRVLVFAAAHPLMKAPARDVCAKRLTKWGFAADAQAAWPGMELTELVHRIVVETPVSHAPLIAAILGAR